ncbi:TIGR02281 family clan AA aspartic protease [Frigidibacter sp. RF13]|uniref:retropepsin-like aspartic protease family protein n=1 Tax=Frigidibacter sp. RF13 TaxID=2997340 RepID=UPI00227023D0|nr:TIGR02281 family clan AA aspartic protease [Frigidibacter sp. RF13]MCY1125504.1 TIGR02281 family clan AA aspartic protease [Frigidibacter sp. RF13]
MDGDTTARLIYLSLLLLAVSGALFSGLRQRTSQTLQQVLIWAFLFAGLVAGYGLWPDIQRALNPRSAVSRDGSLELSRARDGHFYVDAQVNGQRITLLIDTGASDIVLSKADAAHIGIDPATLSFDGIADTANGPVPTARVQIDEILLGPYNDSAVRARVNGGEMTDSLLGMSYLRNFSMRIEGDRLLLSR